MQASRVTICGNIAAYTPASTTLVRRGAPRLWGARAGSLRSAGLEVRLMSALPTGRANGHWSERAVAEAGLERYLVSSTCPRNGGGGAIKSGTSTDGE